MALIVSPPKMMSEKFRAFTRMLLFCPMFSDGVRIEYLSASGISFQTLDKWVHFVQSAGLAGVGSYVRIAFLLLLNIRLFDMKVQARYPVVQVFLLSLSLAIFSPITPAVVLGQFDYPVSNPTAKEYLGVTGPGGRNAPYRMLVPVNWNGRLLVYARGTGTLVELDPLGRPLFDARIPAFPKLGVSPLTNSLPQVGDLGTSIIGATAADPRGNAYAHSLEDALITKGYALVATDNKPDPRLSQGLLSWVVADGQIDIPAVTKEARGILWTFKYQLPDKTILLGRSQGSITTLSTLEQAYGQLYDGAVTACTAGAGASRSWDTAIDLAVIFDALFADIGGWKGVFGIGDIGDINDDVQFSRDVSPKLAGLLTNSEYLPRFEFIRLAMGLPLNGFYPSTIPSPPFPPAKPGSPAFNWLFVDFLFATEVRSDVERRAGGPVGQNADHTYKFGDNKKDYLQSLGFAKKTIDTLLNTMNNTIISRKPRAPGPLYTKANADFTGDISGLGSKPLLSMHTKVDGLVLPSQETEYGEQVEKAFNPPDLKQVYIDSIGHCTLTKEEWLRAIKAIDNRLTDGTWHNTDFKNNEPNLRFDTEFNPGPFPQPR